MEVVLGFDPFLVAEKLDQLGVEVGTSPHERFEVGLDQGNEVLWIDVEPWDPATATESDPSCGFELNRKVIDIERLFLEEATDLTQLAFGRGEGVSAPRSRLLPLSSGMMTM